MKEITIILPIHKIDGEQDIQLLRLALDSVVKNNDTYNSDLTVLVVGPKSVHDAVMPTVTETLGGTDVKFMFLENCTDKTDFCSQVNFAAQKVDTDYFSILEYDDEYMPKWFSLAQKYYPTHEDVSVFLPLTVQNDGKCSNYVNELPWAMSFTNEIGVVDADCLQNTTAFNLTGGIFNTKDFVHIGGFDAEIPIAFNYEFLLRITNDDKFKVFVVPRMGYVHRIGRKGSLLDIYNEEYTGHQAAEYFRTVREKYAPTEEETEK